VILGRLKIINKKDKDDGSNDTLSETTKQLQRKTKKDEQMSANVESYDDTDALSLTAIDGRRNPQDCSGQANKAKKEDTNKCVLPVDSNFQGDKGYNEEWDSYYDRKKRYLVRRTMSI